MADLDIHSKCVYTIRHPDELRRSDRGHAPSPWLREGKRWSSVPALLTEARAGGAVLPVLFVDSRKTSNIIFMAELADVVVNNDGTRFRFRELTALVPFP